MLKTLVFSLLISLPAMTKAAKNPKVEFITNKGKFVVELDQKKAPKTVANFLKYVKEGYYNGTAFHRVIGNFAIQGGGFEVKDGKLKQKKTGKPVVNEASNGLKNTVGTIAMARTRDPHSATAQFYINVADNVALNYSSEIKMGYTVFGKVLKGMDTVNKIKTTPTARISVMPLSGNGSHVDATFSDVPKENIVITKVQILK